MIHSYISLKHFFHFSLSYHIYHQSMLIKMLEKIIKKINLKNHRKNHQKKY